MNDLQDIPLHGGQEQLFRLGTVGGLAQHPHQFDCGGFGGHIVRFQHTGQGFGRAANFVHGKVAALMRYLGGEHSQVPRAAPVPHGGKHGTIIPAGQAAHAKAFQHQSAVTALQQGDDIRPHARHQPQHKHIGVQRGTEHRMGILRRALQELDQAAVPEHGSFGIINAGKRVKTLGSGFAGAGAQNHLIVKHDLHAPGIRVAGIGHGAPQVVAGIRIAVINRFLAAGQHHRLGAFLDHVAERCGGIATPADDTLTNSAAEPTAQPEQPQATAEPLVFGWPVADFHYIARFVSDYHRGADYSATKGTPVLAVYGGTVAVANSIHPSYGNHVVIDHGTLPDGHSYRTLYAHMDTLSVAVGDTVTQGQQLGTVGSTGASTGNHLHLELFVDGALTDTRTMIPYDNTTSPDLHLTTTLDFICPLKSYTAISAPFRTDDSDTPPHLGVDFAAAGGTPVQAAQSGVVTQAGWDDDHGYFVTIYHGANAAANDDGTYPANYATSYAHLQSKPAVQVGQRVAQGDVIGYVGSTGSSTGNHLHFQLLVNGTPVDPLAMLPQ